MLTNGFVFNYSDLVSVGTAFPFPSYYIYVSGNSGDIVYQNSAGLAQYFPAAQAGMGYAIGATKILSSAMVNGVSRTTGATGLVYCCGTIP